MTKPTALLADIRRIMARYSDREPAEIRARVRRYAEGRKPEGPTTAQIVEDAFDPTYLSRVWLTRSLEAINEHERTNPDGRDRAPEDLDLPGVPRERDGAEVLDLGLA